MFCCRSGNETGPPPLSRLQSKIARILGDLLSDGEAIVKLAIETEDRTKVPDVVWASKATIAHRSLARIKLRRVHLAESWGSTIIRT
jgi:hypothetical protein